MVGLRWVIWVGRAWLAAVCLLAACAVPPLPDDGGAPKTAVIYVIQRSWHTDIGLPVREITEPLASLEHGFPGVRFLTFGFGERQYLMSRKVTIGETLSALLPSRSAVLMTALLAPPEAAFGADNVVVVHISAAGLARLEAAIWSGFERTPTGEAVRLADGPYVGSVFYAARDTYDGFNTCNTWTATMLRAAGLAVATTGVLFSGQVMEQARWLAR